MTSEQDRIDRLIRPQLRAMEAYHVPPAGDLIKLDAMENPYPWPEDLVDEWVSRLRLVELNRYPDPGGEALKATMRAVLGVPESAAVLLGNGSDELIQMIIQSVAGAGRVVMAPNPTFVMYRTLARVADMDYAEIPLGEDYSLDPEALLAGIEEKDPAVIFLAYPNNPTGNLFDKEAVEAILSSARGLVVVDEAYAPFTDASFLPVVMEYENLLVLRTLSKMGLAGLRLGMLAGATDWLAEIDKTRLPYNISTLNQVTGVFALSHAGVFREQAQEIRVTRGELFSALRALPGLTVYPSEANFILFRVPEGRAREIHAGLITMGVLIKLLDGSSERLRDCLRVTVGQPAENAAFLAALKSLLH